MNYALEPRFAIGTQYISRGKAKNLCTVVDIHKTYNNAGDLVKMRYVATHDFLGQIVTDYDVCDTSISMALYDQEQAEITRRHGIGRKRKVK